MCFSMNCSSTFSQSSKIGKRPTNENATVMSGTIASSVVNDRLPAVRARSMSRSLVTTRSKKRKGLDVKRRAGRVGALE